MAAFVASAWIGDQAAWHEEKQREKRRSARSHHTLGYILFGATFVLAVLHLFGVGHHSQLGAAIGVLAIVLPAWGAGFHAMAALHGYERIAERSEQMHRILTPLVARARAAPTWQELEAVVLEAATVMEAESHEWAISLRYRGLELPA